MARFLSPIPQAEGRPQPFFEDKVRAFWTLQVVGWSGWFVLRAVSGLSGGQELIYLAPLLISGITGFSLTTLLAVIFRSLMKRRPLVMWTATILSILIATIAYSFIDASMVAIQLMRTRRTCRADGRCRG